MTYEDPDLSGTQADITQDDANIGRNHPLDNAAPPLFVDVSPLGWDFEFVAPVQPEQRILADTDAGPITRCGMFSPILGTPHPGWYLDRQK